MSQDFKQEDMFSDASFHREMTPAQRRASIVPNSTSRSLPTPEKLGFSGFAAPSTQENFKHPARKSDAPQTESPSKRRKTGRLTEKSIMASKNGCCCVHACTRCRWVTFHALCRPCYVSSSSRRRSYCTTHRLRTGSCCISSHASARSNHGIF
jgi:hypothetical protein